MDREEQWRKLLKTRFGFDDFREGQLEALKALSEEKKVLCILPTGRGKSLLYQFPSLLLPGMTLIISPLLALMRDQVGQLKNRFGIDAAALNSDQSIEENEAVRQAALLSQLKLLFVSPEQLDHAERFAFLQSLPISLVVIDEAHCISTWGHDFRPSYRQIVHLLKALELKGPRILALTATADQRTEKDIQKQIGASRVIRESLDRPNIKLSTLAARGLGAKLHLTEQLLMRFVGQTVLIYCATRENCELVAEHLIKKKFNTIAYHAGLEPERKREIQGAFLNDTYKVIAATNALGMGIDKANIRAIIHFDIPGSITAYYQEVGRSGRDGLPAEGILLYDWVDKKIQEYFISSAMPERADFDAVLAVGDGLTLAEIKQKTGLHPTRVQLIIAELVEQGFLVKELKGRSQIYRKTDREEPVDLVRYDNQLQVKTEELKKMTRYAESRAGCRMAMLRIHLGDPKRSDCQQCDLCRPATTPTFVESEATAIDAWIQQKPLIIAPMKLARLNEGLSLIDAKLRSPAFIRFMKGRQEAKELDEEILALCKKHLECGTYAAVIPLPSRTWSSRLDAAGAIARHLRAPLLDLLSWKEAPEKRQGELLNNDQRGINVKEKMIAQGSLPEGPILLIDDYIGSGATMKEAARAVRALSKNPILVPFTIATVKWRLGATGFV